jgi:UDP-N-acetylmuramyl pentapeptide phosphotransferase/UDP-N-acetylglucosamine-1-phosphate transferase
MATALTLVLAFAASAWGTRHLIDWLSARNVVATENHRTMHAGAIPQGGGMAILVVGLVLGLGVWPWPQDAFVLVPVMVALAALSAANDRKDIPVRWRLAAHIAAAALLLTTVPESALIWGGLLPWALDRLAALVAIVWFINLYNFMDGIDGLAGVETITLTLGAVAVAGAGGAAMPLEGQALAMAGAAAGFLVWNWHKARIFMGDVGSVPLGLFCAALLIHIAATQSLAAAVILPLYYLADATLTLGRRFLRGENLSEAHRSHAYQRAAKAVGSHSAIVVRIAACNGVLVAAALLALKAPILALLAALAAVTALLRDLETLAASAPHSASPLPRVRATATS